tara:strand:+ start:1270 stop:2472 length:1203 start_codon:yes stop_codon:yes gene_type:complete
VSHQTLCEKLIHNKIKLEGKITFADFMDIALYDSNCGYYNSQNRIGASGDFYTSPIIHPSFGAIICKQLFSMWVALKKPSPFFLIEIGANNDRLILDIREFAKSINKKFFENLECIIIDRSKILESHNSPENFHTLISNTIPFKNISGCILSNEFFDALPINKFQIKNDIITEIYLTIENNELKETNLAPHNNELCERITELYLKSSDNYIGEINVSIEKIIKNFSNVLKNGFVITIDYGDITEKLVKKYENSSIQTYSTHTKGTNPYTKIGEQDITADVNFSQLILAGKKYGLNSIYYANQSDFLKTNGINYWINQLHKESDTTIKTNNLGAIYDLINPNGLGNLKVLIQEKNTTMKTYNDLGISSKLSIEEKLPMQTTAHLNIAQAKYPHTIVEKPLW